MNRLELSPRKRRTRRYRPYLQRWAPYWPSALTASIFAAALAAIFSASPMRTSDSPRGTRLLSEENGYKPAVDSLAKLGLLKVSTKPRRGDVPEQRSIEIDQKRLARLIAAGPFSESGRHLGDCSAYADRTTNWIDKVWNLIKGTSAQVQARDACLELIEIYRQKSYLRDDMLWANPDIWEISGDSVSELHANSHVLRESGLETLQWRGRLLYADGASGLNQPRWRFADPRSEHTINPFLSSSVSRAAGELLRQSKEGLRYFWLDRGLVIEAPPIYSGPELLLDGDVVISPTSAPARRPRLIPVMKSQTLGLYEPRTRKIETWQLVDSPANLSELAPNGRRYREPRFAALIRQLEGYPLRGDLATSVHRNLQSTTQSMLEAWLAAAAKKSARTVRAGILLMDGMTGEIAAAASFPAHPSHLARTERQDPRRQIWLEQNMNFEPLPIGSVAKVPFAAAIALAYPEVLGWEIPYAAYRCVDFARFTKKGDAAVITTQKCPLGYIGLRPTGNGKSKTTSFSRFIAYSNNFFAVRLLQYARRRSQDIAAGPQHWGSNIDDIACIKPFDGGGSNSSGRSCSGYLWRDTFHRQRGTETAQLQLDLDRPNAEAPYGGYYVWILGGGDGGRWTGANLGQAYARLISGRASSPRLTAASADDRLSMPRLADTLVNRSNYPSVWKGVVSGMTGVLREGTASNDFKGAVTVEESGWVRLAGGKAFLFAKTGTPTVEEGTTNRDGSVLVLAAARTTDGKPPIGIQSICQLRVIVINLQYRGTQTTAAGLARQLVGKQAIRKWIDMPCEKGRRGP